MNINYESILSRFISYAYLTNSTVFSSNGNSIEICEFDNLYGRFNRLSIDRLTDPNIVYTYLRFNERIFVYKHNFEEFIRINAIPEFIDMLLNYCPRILKIDEFLKNE